MELIFSKILEVGNGLNPDIIQFPDTSAEVFFLEEGRLKGQPILKTDGVFSVPELEPIVDISPDHNISDFKLRVLSGFGVIGSYKTEDAHKLLIYEYMKDISDYLENGSISSSIQSPIDSMSLTLQNPMNKVTGQNVIIGEKELLTDLSKNNSLISPGSKIAFEFMIGDSEVFSLGNFLVDRTNFTLLGETISVTGRNLIGKVLKEQTLDENYVIPYGNLKTNLENLLVNANLSKDQFIIENTSIANRFDFKPNTTVFDAISEMLKSAIDWKIQEKVDGLIVIGSPSYSGFEDNSIYNFERGKDIFSRKVVKDDLDAYRKVCVHDSDFNLMIFKEVESYSGWNLNANKTLYVEVATGTREADAILYAEILARKVDSVGKIESFNGPFRPHIICQDGANIVDDTDSYDLGIITGITHSFGKNGFSTKFIVDSGGSYGTDKFTNYINKMAEKKIAGVIGYE